MNFITLDEYKASLNITSPKQDAEFSLVIDAVNQFITDYLGFAEGGVFKETVYMASNVEALDRVWGTITSVKTEEDEALTFKLVKGYILKIAEPYIGNVTIEGELATNAANAALKHAAFLLVQYYSKDQFMQSISNNGGSISLPSFLSIPLHIKSILDLYRVA